MERRGKTAEKDAAESKQARPTSKEANKSQCVNCTREVRGNVLAGKKCGACLGRDCVQGLGFRV